MSEPKTFRLPPLEALWPWPRAVNVHLANIEQESLDWCFGFKALEPEAHRFTYERGNFTLLAGMMFARASKEVVQTACELMLVFFTFDDHTDEETPDEVWHNSKIMIDALTYPDKPRPKGEWVGGEIGRQFWLRRLKASSETFQRRFLKSWIDYVKSVVKEAEYRSQERILDLESYMELRRHTIGAFPTLLIHEMDLNIPDNVREHPVLTQLEVCAVDMILIGNDILSFVKEQAYGGREHNIVTIIMEQSHIDLQQAVDKAGELFREQAQKFDDLYRQLPRWFGPVDLYVQKLVDGMASCVSANMHWSYETPRYFGSGGFEVKKTRVVNLLPRIDQESNGGNPSMLPLPSTQGVMV